MVDVVSSTTITDKISLDAFSIVAGTAFWCQ